MSVVEGLKIQIHVCGTYVLSVWFTLLIGFGSVWIFSRKVRRVTKHAYRLNINNKGIIDQGPIILITRQANNQSLNSAQNQGDQESSIRQQRLLRPVSPSTKLLTQAPSRIRVRVFSLGCNLHRDDENAPFCHF